MTPSLTTFSVDFLRRALRMTAALTLLGALYMLVYYGMWESLAFLSGGVWGMVNILFIRNTVRAALTPGEVDKLRVFGLLLIKFPALYFAGYGLLSFDKFDPVILLLGSTVFFAVVILKALGRAVIKIDDHPEKAKRESVLN